MITATTQSKITTLLGLLVAALGTLLQDTDFQNQLAVIVPTKYASVIQVVGLLVTALGPSLKSHSNQLTRVDDPTVKEVQATVSKQ